MHELVFKPQLSIALVSDLVFICSHLRDPFVLLTVFGAVEKNTHFSLQNGSLSPAHHSAVTQSVKHSIFERI